jgi:SAM-dependent methyltransferase
MEALATPAGRPADGALAAYESLAPFYDAFTHDYPHERWLADLERLARRHGLRGRRLLDVACGTAKSTLPLVRRGYRAHACDLSPAMVAEAGRKLAPHGVEVRVADMRRLPWARCFDLVTCLDDAVNYLVEPVDLRAALRSMGRALAPGGLLVFDTNTLFTYRTAFAGDSVVAAGGARFRWRGSASAAACEGAVCSATIEVVAGGRRSRSRHVQRHHPRAEVEAALVAASLEPLAAYGLRAGGGIEEDADEERDLKSIYMARAAGSPPNRRGGVSMVVKPG